MVAVIFRLWPVGLAELHILVLAHLDAGNGAVAVPKFGGKPNHRRIKSANTLRRANRHVELDIGDAERDAPEPGGVRLIAAHAIAPGTGRLDVVVVLAEPKFGAFQLPG